MTGAKYACCYTIDSSVNLYSFASQTLGNMVV